MKKISYRADIDGLRGIAILVVLLFHTYKRQFPGGFIGVDVFFVISGFLITKILFLAPQLNTSSIIFFYIRRVLRILPTLIITLALCLITGWFSLTKSEYKNLSIHTLYSCGFIQNFLSMSESREYFNTRYIPPMLLNLWSLGVEEQFYLTWPLILSVLIKKKNFLITSIILIIFISFTFNIYKTYSSPLEAFYHPFSRAWELLVGALIAYLQNNSNIKNYFSNSLNTYLPIIKNILSLVGIIMILSSILLINEDKSNFPGYIVLLPILGTAFTISAGSQSLINKHILSNKILVFIGLISYPLYLLHWPILTWFKIVLPNNYNELKPFIIILTIIFSFLIYKYVEQPIRRTQRQSLWAIFCILMIILIGIISNTIVKKDGIKSRESKEVQLLTSSIKEKINDSSCFIDLQENIPSNFFNTCVADKEIPKPHFWIYGDSTAHSISNVFHDLLPKDNRLSVTTLAACSPWDTNRKDNIYCGDNNKLILAKIIEANPQHIIISSSSFFKDYEKNISYLIKHLGTSTTSSILIVGPPPKWQYVLPLNVLSLSQNHPFNRIKSKNFIKKTSIGIDINSQQASENKIINYLAGINYKDKYGKSLKLNYFSAINNFCTNSKCLMLSPTDSHLLSYDYHHLTDSGSKFLSSKILKHLFVIKE